MADNAYYSKAPITEATIDLRITPTQGFSVEDLVPLREAVADRYPIQEEEHLRYQQMSFVGTDLLQTEGGHQLNGFRFVSEDKREIFYARLDGGSHSVSKLPMTAGRLFGTRRVGCGIYTVLSPCLKV